MLCSTQIFLIFTHLTYMQGSETASSGFLHFSHHSAYIMERFRAFVTVKDSGIFFSWHFPTYETQFWYFYCMWCHSSSLEKYWRENFQIIFEYSNIRIQNKKYVASSTCLFWFCQRARYRYTAGLRIRWRECAWSAGFDLRSSLWRTLRTLFYRRWWCVLTDLDAECETGATVMR